MKEYITKTDLKLLHGFTDSIINKFLPVPDIERKNPFNSNMTVKLYLKDKAVKICESKEFLDLKRKSDIRVEQTKIGIKTREEKVLSFANSLEIEIVKLSPNELLRRAIYSYNEYTIDRKRYENIALTNSDSMFLNRITVNYIRHNLTNYEEMLYQLFGKTGKSKAINIIRKKIYDKIGSTYPWLKDECDRQLKLKTEIN